jgi:GAF domain-containing protein
MEALEEYRINSNDEPYRLDAVKRYKELNLEKEKALDGFVKLASQVCNVPIALIAIVDEHKQHYIAKIGFDLGDTPRQISFCNTTILRDDLFVVTDTLRSPQFVHNPFVEGYPNIRFYAGIPLKSSDGYNIGSLCVIDRKPRHLNKLQMEGLKMISRQIITLLELRLSLQIIQQQKQIIDNKESEFKDRIIAQNNQLKEISKIQSHQIRGPVSTIKGLMELIKEDKPVVNPEYLTLLEIVVEQLDEAIKDIVRAANNSLINL